MKTITYRLAYDDTRIHLCQAHNTDEAAGVPLGPVEAGLHLGHQCAVCRRLDDGTCGTRSEWGHVCRMERDHDGNCRYSATPESEANRRDALECHIADLPAEEI